MSGSKQYGHYEKGVDSDSYIVHVSAMTSEKLHSKSEIAAELAYRDDQISRQRDALIKINQISYDASIGNLVWEALRPRVNIED